MFTNVSGIEVRLDLTAACDALRVPADQRALLTLRFNEPASSDAEAGRQLGWDPKRLDRVVKSLKPDRVLGFGLRQRLAAYLPDKNLSRVCPEKRNLSA